MENTIQNNCPENERPKKQKSKEAAIITVLIAGAIIALAFVTAAIMIVSSRSVFLSKQQMMDSVMGSYKYVVYDYYDAFCYKYLVVREDEVKDWKSSYSAYSTSNFDYDYDYEIKRWNYLTGKITLYNGAYLIVNKDGDIIYHQYLKDTKGILYMKN